MLTAPLPNSPSSSDRYENNGQHFQCKSRLIFLTCCCQSNGQTRSASRAAGNPDALLRLASVSQSSYLGSHRTRTRMLRGSRIEKANVSVNSRWPDSDSQGSTNHTERSTRKSTKFSLSLRSLPCSDTALEYRPHCIIETFFKPFREFESLPATLSPFIRLTAQS